MDAYQEGENAFYDGRAIDENPYPETDIRRDEWEDGYFRADIYESGDCG
jgi:hypothetical protein